MADVPATANPKPAGERRLLLLAGTIFFGVAFGVVAAVAFAAWAGALLPGMVALVLGLLLAWGLPLFLSVRAAIALKKRNPARVLLRRVVALFLVGLVQLTVFLAGFVQLGQGTATTAAEMANAALPMLGPVPIVGGMLEKIAREGGALDPTKKPDEKMPDATTDAGPGAVVSSGLQARAGGRPIGAVAAGVQTTEGDIVVVAFQVSFGGQVVPRVIDLSAFSALGNPTRVEASSDGDVVVVLGGSQLLVARAKAATAEHDRALSRGGKIADLDIQTVRDVAIGPGGALLVVVDAFDAKKNAVVQALVARPVGGAPFIVRRAGDVVDKATKDGELDRTAHGFSIKRNDGSGAVVVEEEFLEGDSDVGTKISGAQWVMNPRRLLAGQLDNPRALAEVVRTGDDPSGVENVTLQAFADAVLLPDGRVVFDANYVEEGPRGWLFSARIGSAAFAVGPDLVGKPEAPFGERAPRTRYLAVEPDGTFAFVNRDGALVLGPLARPAEAKVSLLRADAIRPADGARAGGVAAVTAVRLCKGGEWVIAGVDLLADGGARNEAVVLAGRDDLLAGKAEVLLEQGGFVPTPSPALLPQDKAAVDAGTPSASAAPRRIKSLFFDEGHDEPLWHAN